MSLSLRYRILLTLAPLLALLAGLGATAIVLLQRLGGSIDLILRENYESVIAMERLNEALERIDSSFQFALAGEEQKARAQYQENWEQYDAALGKEAANVTIHPTEDELVARLQAATDLYRRQGQAFYEHPSGARERRDEYFEIPGGLSGLGASTVGLLGSPAGEGPLLAASALVPGRTAPRLLDTFGEIKDLAGGILRLNQENMVEMSRQARQTATNSVIGFSVALLASAVAALLLARQTLRGILQPIQAVTQSALAIGAGNLDQVVPVLTRDELGHLADAFNLMARQLRSYRQTDYSRLLRAQRTSQATIDSFPDPVLVVDPAGQVEMANPAAQNLFGVPGKREDKQAPLPWQPPEALRGLLQEALGDQHPYLPQGFDRTVQLHTGGQERSFLPRVLPIRDPWGQTLGAAVLLQDVTRFRLLDQVKSDLVATASHELKTPLTGVRLALHLLLEEAVGPLTAKQTELLVDARDNAERLLAMVNNLLDLARLEQGREHLDLRAEAPADLLRAAADGARPRAEDKGVTVVVEVAPDLPPVAADAQRLGHALGNLLDNALQYTDPGGRITLSATPAGDRVTLAVADTGLGIPPEHLPHVFDRFFRVPGRSREAGTGLGLAIVREIVQGHGGSVTCESRPGEGTVFRLSLPVWEYAGMHKQ
jgi:two-component system, NtrC family, sensor histidine kinase KinB